MSQQPQRTPKAKGNGRIITGVCRLSFPSLFETELDMNKTDTGKYATALLFSKDDTAMVAAVNQAIEEAKQRGIREIKEWRGKWPATAHNPLGDGDERPNPLDGYDNAYYLRARSKKRPKVIDQYKNEIAADHRNIDDLVYAGANAVASIDFYPFYTNGKAGIGVSLNAVQVLPGGDKFGGGGFDADDFEAEEADLSDDDL